MKFICPFCGKVDITEISDDVFKHKCAIDDTTRDIGFTYEFISDYLDKLSVTEKKLCYIYFSQVTILSYLQATLNMQLMLNGALVNA